MRNKLKILATILSLSMALSQVVAVFAEPEEVLSEEEELQLYLDSLEGQNYIEDESEEFEDTSEESQYAQEAIKEEEAKKPIVTSSKKLSNDVKSLIAALGILTDAEMKVDTPIARNFAAEVVARMMKADTSQAATGTVFTDVKEDTPYAYAIELTAQLQYFYGTGNGEFSPEIYITDYQMATVLLRFIGYAGRINIDDKYSALYKHVNTGNELTMFDMANMIYNMLNMGTLNIESLDKNGSAYSIDRENTILNTVFEVEEASGIIEKNGMTGLYSASGIAEDEITIATKDGNITLKVGETDIADAIGRYVNVYYLYDSKTGDGTCIGYEIVDSKNNVVEIALSNVDFDATTKEKLVYIEDGKSREQEIKYSSSTAIIYNGTFYSDADFSIDMLQNKEGTITFIDNDRDKKYDIMDIKAYEPHQVKSVILSSKIIRYQEIEGEIVLEGDDIDSCEIVNKDGVLAYLEDFDTETVVSIYQNSTSAAHKRIKVIVSKDTVSGIVSNVEENDLGQYIITLDDGTEYPVVRDMVAIPRTGQNVKLYLTAFGNVAKITYITGGDFSYGIVFDTKYNSSKDCVKVTLLTADNIIEEKEISSKVNIDGSTVRNMDEVYSRLTSVSIYDAGEVLPKGKYPIRYRYRQDGSFAEIDTPVLGENESSNSLTLIKKVNDATMVNYVFGLKLPANPDTLVFSITNSRSSSGTNMEDWDKAVFSDTKYTSVQPLSNYVSKFLQSRTSFAAFRVDAESDCADLILKASGSSRQSNGTSLFMVDKVTTVYDEEFDCSVPQISGLLSGVKTSIIASEYMADNADVLDLHQGDVIQYGTNEYGRLASIRIIVKNDPNDKNSKVFAKIADTDGEKLAYESLVEGSSKGKIAAGIMFAYALKREGDLIKIRDITPTNDTDAFQTVNRFITDEIEDKEGWVRIPGSTPVMIYDPTKDEPVYAGTYDEILDNNSTRSIIGLRFQSSTILREAIVINDAR